MSIRPGTLFVVATPIGHLDDLSTRARHVLAGVAVIAAEDTRHSRKLLDHYEIPTPLLAYHEFNEPEAAPALIKRLQDGQDVALISDAGTPLISDPGYRLVNLAMSAGVTVVPIPGPSAPICALSACGLPVNRFAFEGYAPEKAEARRKYLEGLAAETRTLVFLEAPHRIGKLLADCVAVFGAARPATLARELTKKFETIKRDTLGGLRQWLEDAPEQRQGEFVVIVQGAPAHPEPAAAESERVLRVLLQHLSVKDAAAVAAELTGGRRNELYDLAVRLKPVPKPD